jgi:(2Fe-2S) ferredoxin
MPSRERYLFVCTNRRKDDDPKGSCAAKNSEQIADNLKVAIAKLGASRVIRSCKTSCLDLCELGASIVLEPDHVVYGNVKVEDVDEIARATAEGRIVERLRVTPAAAKVEK